MAGRILRVTRRSKAKAKINPKKRLPILKRLNASVLATAILLVSLGVASFILARNLPFKGSSDTNAPPVLYSIKPEYGSAGTKITLKGAGFDRSGNSVIITPQNGMPGYIGNLKSWNRKTIKFAIPEELDLCPPNDEEEGIPCSPASPQVEAGIYEIKVWTSTGTSNSVTFSVIDKEE